MALQCSIAETRKKNPGYKPLALPELGMGCITPSATSTAKNSKGIPPHQQGLPSLEACRRAVQGSPFDEIHGGLHCTRCGTTKKHVHHPLRNPAHQGLRLLCTATEGADSNDDIMYLHKIHNETTRNSSAPFRILTTGRGLVLF